VAVRLEGTIKRFVGRSSDTMPRPGVQGADGTTPTDADIPVGSRFVVSDTGEEYRWNGSDWYPVEPESPVVGLLTELIAETRAVRSGLELYFALERGLNIDLRTEDVSQLAAGE
jgi:hypothetical protein